MISSRKRRDSPTVHAARTFAQLLSDARRALPTSARVCPRCRLVFTPVHAADLRCTACVTAAAEAEAVLL